LLVKIDGKFHAIGGKCSHFGGPLAEGLLHDHIVRCPWHQACFDVLTGEHKEPPALDDLPHFDLKIEEDNVIAIIPDDAKQQIVPKMVKRDPSNKETFIIVGAGSAGNSSAEALRQNGFDGRIIMATREKLLPYDRTSLSKGYLKSDNSNPPLLRSADFYSDYDIEALTEHEVTGIDSTSKSVTFSNGISMRYDKLLLATGSIPRRTNVPGADLENIFTLRTPVDADKIKSLAKKGSKAVVIGSSFIGMETSANLIDRGVSITIVALDAVPFEQILGTEIGNMYKSLHEEKGTTFRLSSKIARFEGDKKVQTVVLESGEKLPADFVILGIGVQPATGFLKGFDLNPDGSLNVDKHFMVKDYIYAVGDIANFEYWYTSERIRIEHWRLAEQHGRIAAQNMAGKEAEYHSIPFFWTNQLGVGLKYIGYTRGWDEIIFQGSPAKRDFIAFFVKKGQISAVTGCGKTLPFLASAELMQKNQMPTVDEIRKGPVDMVKRLK
ncbi:MAG: apoptosis-inducing factor 3, partial [Candidatus Poribacteria bacterium]|nr:apoptosis-inducing factor 3 [Candidatus Poribacteria bacterium]